MIEATYNSLNEALSAIDKIKLSPEDGLKFASIVSTMYGTAPKVQKRGASKDLRSVAFGGHLKDMVKDGPKVPATLVEPLRERGVRLATDDVFAARQIKKGFQKSKDTYREYPEGKWGLLSYAPPKLVEKA